MKNILKYITLVALLISAGESLAWNKLGQNAIATLAERHLTEKAKAEVQSILGGDLVSGTLYLNELRKEVPVLTAFGLYKTENGETYNLEQTKRWLQFND